MFTLNKLHWLCRRIWLWWNRSNRPICLTCQMPKVLWDKPCQNCIRKAIGEYYACLRNPELDEMESFDYLLRIGSDA